jgi:hypothetical protein
MGVKAKKKKYAITKGRSIDCSSFRIIPRQNIPVITINTREAESILIIFFISIFLILGFNIKINFVIITYKKFTEDCSW